jgi:ADP-heptose:LPS heptosyltransferase
VRREFSWKNPKPSKTCAVVRYGAIGDMIQCSSIFPWLKEQGFHLTLYCQAGAGYECVKHDPHVDRFIVQGHNEVPPQFLEEFWADTRKKYDKWVNLCESVECTLLASPGRANWEWPNHLRAKYMDRNYLEWTHELAQVPQPYRPTFYSTPEERVWAKEKARSYGRRNILWSLAGSSGHKTWPHLDTVIAGLMLQYPDVHVVLVGDELCQILEAGWEKERRVHRQSGKWTIRQSMAFAEEADLIIGTETGLLNAAGSMDAWKIVTLSHSSEEMLTKHWKNVIALHQRDSDAGCPKHPCRQLHGANGHDPWEDCPAHADEHIKAALCQYYVGPDVMWAAIQSILGVPMQRIA